MELSMDPPIDRPDFHWKAYFDRAAEALVVLDRAGHLRYANDSAVALTGYPLESVLQAPLPILFSPEEHNRAPFRYDLLDQGQIVRNTRTLRHFDGHDIPVETITSRVGPDDYLAAVRDMTEIRRAQEALRASEEKFSKAFRTSPDSITLTRRSDGAFLEVNEGFTKMTGWTAEELVGRATSPDDLHIWEETDQRSAMFAVLEKQGWVQGVEGKFRRKDGTIVVGQLSARQMTINGESCILAVTRDLTDLRRAEENLRRAQKMEALGVLAGGIAHDFNNLLTGIFGFIQIAQLQLDPGHPAARNLQNALAVFDRAKSLSHQLLTFARGGSPVRKIVDLTAVIEQTVRFALTGSGIRADVVLAPDLWSCKVDPNQISQVLENLVINARQAMAPGGRVSVGAANQQTELPGPLAQGRYVKIWVSDTGGGIHPDHLARIFDPFFSTKPDGTGLGLATSYSIVQRHGGLLTVDTQWGQGSRFDLYLPAEEAKASTEVETAQGPVTVGSLHLLYIDDETYLLEIARFQLTRAGHRPELADTGTEAIRLFTAAVGRGDPFDLVLVDLTLQGGERGPTVLAQLRSLAPQVKAVAVSGYAEDPIMAAPQDFGFLASLPKPFLDADLEALWLRLGPRLPTKPDRW